MDPFVGEIRIFGFNYAPAGWATCQGQLMSIAQNTALFSLLGTYYGGDGRTTFALPNLQGNVALNQGAGGGLSQYSIGQTGGAANVTLLTTQIGAHNHVLNADRTDVGTGTPAGNLFGKTANRLGKLYALDGNTTALAPGVIGPSGGSQPHTNMQPYLVSNYCIALQGVFPQRQ